MANTPEPMEMMLQRRVSELQQQNELMRQLGTTSGFFQAFFKLLPEARTAIEAYNTVNDAYFGIWGEYRYSSWKSFQEAKNNYLKKPNS